MAKKRTTVQSIDSIAQRVTAAITVSGTNATGVVAQIPTNFSMIDRTGIMIHRIKYHISPGLFGLDTSGDRVEFGLSYSALTPTTATHTPLQNHVIDHKVMDRIDQGTAATSQVGVTERLTDFTAFPLGGLLYHPAAIYIWSYTVGTLTGPTIMYVTIYYSYMELTPEKALELMQLAQSVAAL